jgi:hypothetical protein
MGFHGNPKRVFASNFVSFLRNTESILSFLPQCTVKGGREVRDVDAFELAQVLKQLIAF